MIYDPATRVFDAAGNVIRAPTPFPGNRIPANRIHQASRKLVDYYPIPEQERTGANYVNNEARKVDSDQFTYRLDYSQSATMNWFFRHSISHELGYDPFAVPNMGSNTDTDVQQMVLGNTQTIGTNKLNDLRIGYGNLKNAHISPRANVENVVAALGINIVNDNPLYWGVPNIGVTGLSGLGEESDAPFINDDKTIQFVDNFSWILGNHSMKFGGELRRVLYDQIGGVVTRGRFNFDGRYTRQPLLPAAQQRRRGVRGFPAGAFQQRRVAGRRPHRRLSFELLRALYPGQLESDAQPHDRLRFALGIRPAVHRHRRQDRQHRLHVGQQLPAGLRADGHRRSL